MFLKLSLLILSIIIICGYVNYKDRLLVHNMTGTPVNEISWVLFTYRKYSCVSPTWHFENNRIWTTNERKIWTVAGCPWHN
jgi:hypothetical protein